MYRWVPTWPVRLILMDWLGDIEPHLSSIGDVFSVSSSAYAVVANPKSPDN